MLIKEFYGLGDPIRGLIELPDGTFATFPLGCGHKLTEADLTVSVSPLPRDEYLAAVHAYEYTSAPLKSAQMRTFGLTQSPIVQGRWDAGLTQRELAQKAGLNLSQVQKLEAGTILAGNMTAKNLFALADALGIDPRRLI